MKRMLLAAVAAFFTLSTTAFAAETASPAARGSERFKALDTNNDSAVSKDEWRSQGDKMFSENDANKDGKLTAEEMKAHREAKRAEWLKNHPRIGTKAAEKLEGAK
jgi:hypothetical protein